MTLEYVGVLALVIGLIGLWRPSSFIVYCFVSSTLLGSAAAFVLDALGGTNISPSHLLLGFLTLRLLGDKELAATAGRQITFGRPGFWLLVTVFYSLIGAFCLPRLLAGDTQIFAVRASTPFSVPLAPSMSNLTQSIYFTADLVCFIVLSAYASTAQGTRILATAALFAAGLNLTFAVLDLATYFTNTTELFEPIRNANYAMLDEAEVAGLKRIVGSFTEASAFASATLCYFAFTSRLWLLGIKPRLTFPLALLSFLAVILATSSTGYVGLAALLGIAYLQALWRVLTRPTTTQMQSFVYGAPFVIVITILLVSLNQQYSMYVENFLNGVLFDKLSTASGIERSSWNTQALQNFVDTFGFGVGNGSVRASSFPVAVLASTGVIGTLLFGAFFVTLFRARNDQLSAIENAYRDAARMACLSVLITASISGALVDLGLPFYIFASLCSAQRLRLTSAKQEPSLTKVLSQSVS